MTDSRPLGTMRYYFDQLCETHPPTLTFRATNQAEWMAWHAQLTARLRELLVFPTDSCDLEPIVLETVDVGPYLRETLSFQTEPGFRIPAYRLRPKLPPAERIGAAVLCLHGHGRGMDDVAGIAGTLKERQQKIRVLGYDYGHELALRGYTVLIPNTRAMGTPAAGDMDCKAAMTAALLLGKTLVGLRVHDTMRSIDLLLRDSEVDPARIGCVGFSWGGTQAMYLSALDSRVAVSVISGAFGTFKDALIDSDECPCQYVPNLLRVADLTDIVAAIAPRALLIQNGANDQHYTRELVPDAFDRVANAYRLLDAEAQVTLDLFAGNHVFHGESAFPWLEARL